MGCQLTLRPKHVKRAVQQSHVQVLRFGVTRVESHLGEYIIHGSLPYPCRLGSSTHCLSATYATSGMRPYFLERHVAFFLVAPFGEVSLYPFGIYFVLVYNPSRERSVIHIPYNVLRIYSNGFYGPGDRTFFYDFPDVVPVFAGGILVMGWRFREVAPLVRDKFNFLPCNPVKPCPLGKLAVDGTPVFDHVMCAG